MRSYINDPAWFMEVISIVHLGFMEVISHVISIVHGDYPLVNIPKKNDGKIHHAFSMGKSTISTGPCSIANCLFTRGYRGETTMI
jgi:hypothetical protein